MRAVDPLGEISVEEYLADEARSSVKHEYVGGVVYALAGGRNAHNLIAGNIFAAFHSRLRGQPCRPFNSDTKIRIRLPTQVRFYYPDVSVICRPNPQSDFFQDEPAAVVEVLSAKTRRLDEEEKKDAYLTIPTLAVYLLVEQQDSVAFAFRRTEHRFVREVYRGLEAVIPLPELGIVLRLGDVYESVDLLPEPPESETL